MRSREPAIRRPSHALAAPRIFVAAAIALIGPMGERAAWAEDGVYGRFEGDVTLEAGAGVALGAGGPSGALELGATYLRTAGGYLFYADGLGGGAEVRRSLAAGISVRPLFLARYASDLEHGPAHLDLLLDSLALRLGAFWASPRAGSPRPGDPSGGVPGLELGFGAELPLLGRASGPFVGFRAIGRWPPEHLTRGGGGGLVDRGAFACFTIGWHELIGTHVVDFGDRLER